MLLYITHSLPRTILCCVILFGCIFLSAKPKPPPEEKFRLIHADKLFLSKVYDENILELTGNVHFFYGKTEFKSHQAYIFDMQKIVRLIGNVRVKNDTLHAVSDSTSFYRILNRLYFGGNVEITEQEKKGTFNRFRCQNGIFDRAKNTITTWKNVSAYSQSENARAVCGYAFWDRARGYGYLLEQPQLWSEGRDTVHVRSEKMEYFDEDKKIIATFNVSAVSRDYVMTSDFLIYFLKEEKAVFVGEPKLSSDFSDAVADEFVLFLKDKKLVKAELKDSCLIYFAEERGKPKTNWVQAKYVKMNIVNDYLSDFTAEEKVRYFYRQEPEEKRDFFINQAEGEFLFAIFKTDGKLERMKMLDKIKGIYRFKAQPKK